MDNSPTHDEAKLDTTSWTLDCADVGLNSLLALDGEMLALIAAELGEVAEAERLSARAEALKARIADRLWDRGAQGLRQSALVRRLRAQPGAHQLLSAALRGGAAEQARAMVALLSDPAKFGGDWLLPSVTRDDPAFPDNVYWRGRIWPPLNFLVYQGLKRAGFAGRGEPPGRERLSALPRRMGDEPALPREFRRRQRPRPRPARHRSLLRLGRADAGDRRGRDHRHHALGRVRGHP